jgi:large subunit ribosomal protein L23
MARESKPSAKVKSVAKKEPVKAKAPKKEVNSYDILIYPHLTEKSMNMVEMENKLVFIVKDKANKQAVKEAVEKEFGVKVDWVRTEITRKGYKKAYVKINQEFSASDIASKLGVV